jgi:hypothetical protein
MYPFGTQDSKAPICEEGTRAGVAREGIGQEPRTVVSNGLKKRIPLCRVKCILEVQLKETVVRKRLL